MGYWSALRAQQVLAAPARIALRVEVPLVNAVVRMGAMAVDDLAEQALADHVQHGQVVAAEAPVLQHHAGHAGGLVRFHQIPTLIQRDGTRHFHAGVLAGLHGADRHRRVPLPRRGDDHRVEIAASHQSLEVFVAARIEFRSCPPRPHSHISSPSGGSGVDVADGGNRDALHAQHDFQQARAAPADADTTDANRFAVVAGPACGCRRQHQPGGCCPHLEEVAANDRLLAKHGQSPKTCCQQSISDGDMNRKSGAQWQNDGGVPAKRWRRPAMPGDLLACREARRRDTMFAEGR